MDPLATNYPYFSPYQFAGNKPIMFIDLDGAEFQLPTFEKFKYGDNAAINVITVVDNVAINSVNGGITLVNSGIYTIHKLFTDPTSIPEELKSDLGAMAAETGKYVKAQSSYVRNTPFSMQLKDGVETLNNPESYEGSAELATALFLTKSLSPSTQFAQKNSYIERSSINPNLADNVAIGGAGRTAQYASEWGNSSMKNAINRFAPSSKGVKTSSGKTIYKNSETGIQVVGDDSGNYFRVENTNLPGKRRYLDLDGNIPNNKVVNGKTSGRSQTEYNQATHFNNVD